MKKSLAPSVVTTRDPKGLKFVSIVGAAYNKAGLSEKEAQRINDTPALADYIGTFIAENRSSDKYEHEKLPSRCGNLSGCQPKPLIQQVSRLREVFPEVGDANRKLFLQIAQHEVQLPANVEGWFAIPNWRKKPSIFGSTYSKALQKVLDVIKQACHGKFHNYREGQLDEKHIHQSARTVEFLRELLEVQGHPDILIVPAQFGIRHRGRTVRKARKAFLTNEFGLSAFEVGIMILTHLERLQSLDDQCFDCSGDEFDDSNSNICFDHATYFQFNSGKVEFDAGGVVDACDNYGSTSGFFFQ